MAGKDFNRSMSDYLASKRKKENFRRPSLPKVGRKRSNSVSDMYPELKDNELHIIEGKEPFYARLWKRFKSSKPQETKEADEEPGQEEQQVQTSDEFMEEEAEIEREIESAPGFFERLKSFLRPKPASEPEYEESGEIEGDDRLKKQIESLDVREDEIRVEMDELEQKRKELYAQLISSYEQARKELSVKTDDQSVPRQEFDELEEDLIEISKITTYLIKHLPRRKLDSFKESVEFERLKEILKKRKLIRES